ncbi:hypothetical protein [Streptomyces sp. NPDC002054]|uniref:hypothetical protein n=1 Tax=Streptomyces sp. NPDC002054 TaxID=3154663 RepID=UPI0033314D76
MIGLYVLGLLLLGAAYKVIRGMYYLRKAKRLEAETAVIKARTEATKARTAELLAEQAAEIVAQGFVPGEEIDTEDYMPVPADRTSVVAAVRSGDWQAGAAWVEAAAQDWEERTHRVGVLAEEAANADAWLLAWQAARPGDPTAAVVAADAEVVLAWKLRGAAGSQHTTQEQFRLFHQALIKAQEAVHVAQRVADPADPVPYIVEVRIGRGLRYSHDQFRAVWAEVVKRAPKVQTAWIQAQQFWCAKWYGSHELAEEFGRKAVEQSEPGDLLSLILLRGYFEHEDRESDLNPDVYYKQPEIVAAATTALEDLAAAPDPADRQAIRLRHMLAWVLYWQDRYEETVEQFRHIDGYCGIEPWIYQSGRKASFLKTRDYSVRQVTHGS